MRVITWAARVLATLMGVVGAAPPAGAAEPLQNATELHGPFEIVATGRRIGTGAFPNTSANPFATMEVTSFGVRWKGREVAVPKVGARFWRVLRIVDAPSPSLLVMTTDFHLLSEQAGELRITSFGSPSTNMAELQWLDSENGQPGAVRSFGIQRASPGPDTLLNGGRWLRLSYHTVLDVKTLKAYDVRPWIPSGRGRPMAGLNAGNVPVRAFSPGQTQYVAPAQDYDRDKPEGRYDGLIVVDIPSGDAYAVRLDKRRERYADHVDITGAWIAHYFEWKRDAQGRERLQPREGVKPLPWKGRIVNFSDHIEYRVHGVTAGMLPELKRTLTQRLGAKPVPDGADPQRITGTYFALSGCDHRLAIGDHHDVLSVYAPQADAPPWIRCQDTVRRVAEVFDAELASGRLDRHFSTAPPE